MATANDKFTDYIAGKHPTEQDDSSERAKPRLEEGTIIDKPSFVSDMDGNCWFIDPQAKTITSHK